MLSTIKNPWVRRPLVVLFSALYVAAMVFLAIALFVWEGIAAGREAFAKFMDDWHGPIRNAWRGR